eukprot:scaffold85574_cov60-Phaeocystis_antarctica.AAC.2
MPAELAERLIGECLCGADGWRASLRCAKAEWCAGGNIHPRNPANAVFMAVLSGDAPAQLAGVVRLRRNTAALGSLLPFHAILTDVSDATVARIERERIVVHRWPAPRAPPWAHPVHTGGRSRSCPSSTHRSHWSIDALAAALTPAFVFKKKELLNSGVAVLHATAAERDALWSHFDNMSQPSYRRQRDGGDQEVLNSFWRSWRTVIHEHRAACRVQCIRLGDGPLRAATVVAAYPSGAQAARRHADARVASGGVAEARAGGNATMRDVPEPRTYRPSLAFIV